MQDIKILYEDEQIVVCVKPAGMPSQGDRSSTMDFVSWLKNHLMMERKERKDPPYIGIVHRLDRPVGGVMVYAKTAGAASKLSAQFAKHETDKVYMAVLTGIFDEKEGCLKDKLLKDGRTNTSKIVREGGKEASLDYRVLEEKDGQSLVEVHLHTGRHHQIRVQMAHAGCGIYGDVKYNKAGTEKWNAAHSVSGRGQQLRLFSCSLSFIHPTSGKKMNFKVLPDWNKGTIDGWASLL